MPVLIGSAHILVAVMCAVHIVRTSRPMYWIFIVLAFPWIGSLIYVAAEILPSLFGGRRARAAGRAATKAIDSGREARQALHELEVTRTPSNLKRAADALLDVGRTDEALALYREATGGAFADDPSLLAGRARAEFLAGDADAALRSLESLRQVEPNARMPEEHLLYARALEATERSEEALKEYGNVARYYPGAEAYARWALLLEKAGRDDEA